MFAVNGGRFGGAAGYSAEGDDADQVVPGRPVQTLHLHQGAAAVTAARVFAQNTAHAHLLLFRHLREVSKGLHTPVHLDDRQLDRL